MDNFNRLYFGFFFAVALTYALFVPNVYALSPNPQESIVYRASANTSVELKNNDLTRIRTTATASARSPVLPLNKSLGVNYTTGRVVQLAKKAKNGSPVNLAIIAALATTDYLLDEAGVIRLKPDFNASDPNADYNRTSEFNGFIFQFWNPNFGPSNNTNSGPFYYADTIDQVLEKSRSFLPFNGRDQVEISSTNPNTHLNYFRYLSDGTKWYQYSYSTIRYNCSNVSNNVPAHVLQMCNAVPAVQPSHTLEQIDNLIHQNLQQLPERQYLQIFNNHFNQPLQTAEFQEALEQWLAQEAAANPLLNWDPLTKTLSFVNESGDVLTSQTVQAETVTEEPTQTNQEVKEDTCVVFQVFCDFIDWFKADDEMINDIPEVPFQEINLTDYEQTFNATLGSGSCPSPRPISFGGSTVSFSFETACVGASQYFRPVVIMLATLMAAFIIVGASRR